jgi:hypothetical protein
MSVVIFQGNFRNMTFSKGIDRLCDFIRIAKINDFADKYIKSFSLFGEILSLFAAGIKVFIAV